MLPINGILYQLVSAEIITLDDIEEINVKQKPQDKASFVLNIIDSCLAVGIKDKFYTLLDIMEQDNNNAKVLVKNIKRALMTGKLNIISVHH